MGSSAVAVAAIGIGATTRGIVDAIPSRLRTFSPLVMVVVAKAVT